MATHVCCPIEMEPRTLNQGQLNQAREVAADVVQKMEPQEASVLFREGLRPVVRMREIERIIEEEHHHHQRQQSVFDEYKDMAQNIERQCQCSCEAANVVESPDDPVIMKLREPLSAPF